MGGLKRLRNRNLVKKIGRYCLSSIVARLTMNLRMH